MYSLQWSILVFLVSRVECKVKGDCDFYVPVRLVTSTDVVVSSADKVTVTVACALRKSVDVVVTVASSVNVSNDDTVVGSCCVIMDV